jgi:hypothetical protein
MGLATATCGAWRLFDKLSTEDISIAIDELIGSLGVKEETSSLSLLALLEKKDTQGCVQEIATRLGLPILIRLSNVPKDFRPTDTGFQSSSLSRTDWTGHGVEGITAQVSIPSSLPLFGSFSLAGYPISVRVSENCFERPDTFVAIMAHELSHVLLRSLRHPHEHSELHTDLVPILLGFGGCVRRGRKNIRTTTTNGRTTTHTTTYGYLTDEQFGFAHSKVRGILQRHESDKNRLLTLIRQVQHKVQRANEGLVSFRTYLQHLDEHLSARMRAKDAHRIVQFHTWGYTRDWEIDIAKAKINLEQTGAFVLTLNHYTSSAIDKLKEHTSSLDLESKRLDQSEEAIARDVKTLRRNVGLIFRLRNALWSPKPKSIASRSSQSGRTQSSEEE